MLLLFVIVVVVVAAAAAAAAASAAAVVCDVVVRIRIETGHYQDCFKPVVIERYKQTNEFIYKLHYVFN